MKCKLPQIASSILVAFIGFGLTYCNTKKKDSSYTEVLHFEHDISTDDITSNYDSISARPMWLIDELPNKLNPDLAIELEEHGYKRSEIPENDFDELNSIFACEPVDTKSVTACFPIYRDILIFRKGKKVVKIVQLCFDCDKAHFVGPWENVKAFGQRGEYKKLKALLEK